MKPFSLILEYAIRTVLVESKHDFGNIQLRAQEPLRSKILSYIADIPDDALAEKGREDKPHITIKYGIHTADTNQIKTAISSFKPFSVTLGKISQFENDKYDVLKVDVTGADLHKFHKLISKELECTDTHPEYHPHMTLAYLKTGSGKDFVDDDYFSGEVINVSSVVFSDKDSNKTTIQL